MRPRTLVHEGARKIERVPSWLRWLLFLPASLGTGFLVAGVVAFLHTTVTGASSGSVGYIAAFVSGLTYVCAVLYVAYTVVPRYKPIVASVLGIFLLGDLAFVHLVFQPDLFQEATSSGPGAGGLGVLLNVLRADDYRSLEYGGVVKLAGALTGLFFAWHILRGKPG